MSASKQQLLTVAIVSTLIVSLGAFAGTSAAVETTVDGPDTVERPGTATFDSSVTIRDGERVPVENLTLTLRTADDADERVTVTFTPNGTVESITPDEGVVGEGEIRVDQLRRSLEITPAQQNVGYGYGYGYGYDERTNDSRVDFGYGYGFAANGSGDATLTYEISFDSTALKHGDYELFLSVNTEEERGLFQSNVGAFTVETASGQSPPNAGDNADDSDDTEDDAAGDDADDTEDDADEDADDGVDEDADDGDSEDSAPGGNGPPVDRGNGNGPPDDRGKPALAAFVGR